MSNFFEDITRASVGGLPSGEESKDYMPTSSEDPTKRPFNDPSINRDEMFVESPLHTLKKPIVNYGLGTFGENINCVLVGFKEEEFIHSFQRLFKKRVSTVCVINIASATTIRFDDTRRLPDLVLIDLDDLDRTSSLDDLIHLRNGLHRMPLIIGSRYFIDDDLSAERSAVADASIVLPTTMYSLKRVLTAAVHNNKKFRESHIKFTMH